MNLASRLWVIAAIVGSVACDSSSVDPVVDPVTYKADGLSATVAPPQLTISNESAERISYQVMDAEYAALALRSLSGWPTIEPFGRVSLEYSSIVGYGYGESKDALIDYAPAPATPGGPVDPQSIKVLKLTL